MAEEPEVIRERIEGTREQMGETLDALAAKADVKGRAKDWVADKKEAVVDAAKGAASKVTGAGQSVTSTMGEKTPDAQQVQRVARRAGGMARENPLGLAIGAAAFGFIVGLVIPTTSVEHEKLGPAADQVKDRAKELGHEALDRGKEVAKEAASSATEAAKEAGTEQVLGWTPARSISVAWPWRRSWNRTAGRPFARQNRHHAEDSVAGCSGLPSPASTTASEAPHRSPARSRRAAWWARCRSR
jgi:ElaB/YqjD/DUF883 family membrane-anchored ribosome-binding protein